MSDEIEVTYKDKRVTLRKMDVGPNPFDFQYDAMRWRMRYAMALPMASTRTQLGLGNLTNDVADSFRRLAEALRLWRCRSCYSETRHSFALDAYVCDLCGRMETGEQLAGRSRLRRFLDRIQGMEF